MRNSIVMRIEMASTGVCHFIYIILNAYSWMHLNIVENVQLFLSLDSRIHVRAQSFCEHLCALERAQYKE